MPRRSLKGCLIALIGFVLLMYRTSAAESLPSQGTFQGIYYVTRAGVGHFKFFIVPPELKEPLADYDGKYIELEVLDAVQPMNPGLAYIRKIGRIKELPPPPIQVGIKKVVPGTAGQGSFDIVYDFRNASRQPIVFDANNLSIDIEGPGAGQDGGRQKFNFITPVIPGEMTYGYTRRVQLQPGEAVPFVWHSIKVPPGQYELAVSTSVRDSRRQRFPVLFRQPLDFPLTAGSPRAEGLTVSSEVTRQDEWLIVKGQLKNDAEEPQHIFVQEDKENVFLPGAVQLIDERGEVLPTDLYWQEPFAPWVRREITRQGGLPFEFRVRQADLFSRTHEDRIDFWTVTEHGLEKVAIATDLPHRELRPEVPWGAADSGCRMRVQLSKDRCAASEQVRFAIQVDCDRRSADILWIQPGDLSVQIDGKPAALYSTRLPEEHVLHLPHQGEITLNRNVKLTAGKHKLKVIIRGRGGTYTNLHDRVFRKFDGLLISNEAEFEVSE